MRRAVNPRRTRVDLHFTHGRLQVSKKEGRERGSGSWWLSRANKTRAELVRPKPHLPPFSSALPPLSEDLVQNHGASALVLKSRLGMVS